ncbi:MAG: hypothetical protein K2N55_12745 [Lachnospiraceae bacterium]|nr:hypothetical protein [Lachnospiraceae bacterium]
MSIMSELIGIAGTAFGVWGVALTISSNKKSRKLKAVTWSDIHSATKFFWKKLKKQDFYPDYIITPGQKGGIIAQLIKDFYDHEIPILSGFLEANQLGGAGGENDFIVSTTKWNVHMPISINKFTEKEKVKLLIVDDFAMSGDFLHLFKNSLVELGYSESNIRSCIVAVTKVALDANKGPDYYWKVVDDKEFNFPWGKAE